MKNLKLGLIIFLILIIGVFLIYSIASRFLIKIPTKEITVEIEKGMIQTPKIDYLAPNFELIDIGGENKNA